MESLQPDDQQWTDALESIEQSSYAQQSFELLQIQGRHQKILDENGIASLAYGTLDRSSQSLIDNTPPLFRRYFVYRRIHPKHSVATRNVELGVMFLRRDQEELENGFKALPTHVPVAEIIEDILVPSDKNEDTFSDNERQIVYDLIQEILTAQDNGTLADIKYDLSGIVDHTGTTDKPTPFL